MRIRFRLREKVMLITVSTILLSVGINVCLNLKDFIVSYKESVKERVFSQSIELKHMIEYVTNLGVRLGELKGLNKECSKVVRTIPYAKYCYITDDKGTVRYHNQAEKVGAIYSDSITQKALMTKVKKVQYFRSDSGDRIYDFSISVNGESGQRISIIRIGVLSTIIDKEIIRLIRRAIILGIAVILLAGIAVLFITNFSILKPVKHLVDGISKFGEGAFDTRIKLTTKDEVSEIAESFNKMADELNKSTVSIETLKATERRFQDIADNTEDWIWEVDTAGRYTYSSPVAEKVLGYKVEELLGKYFYDYFHPNDREKLKRSAFEAFDQKKLFRNFKNQNIRKDGKVVILETSGVPILNEDGRLLGYRGADRDITDRILGEEALRKAKEAADEANKELNLAIRRSNQMAIKAEEANQAKSDFLANMSHELRTPINHIIGFTELVVFHQFGELNEQQKEFLTDVLHSSNHLLSLINDILDLSKVEAGMMELNLEDVNIGELLTNSIKMINERTLKHGIKLQASINGIPESARVDARKIKQIIYNLLSNAVKFTPDGGEVTLKARTIDGLVRSGQRWNDYEDIKILEHPLASGETHHEMIQNCIEIVVSDTGIGILKDDQERIFDAFEQVDGSSSRRHEGTGLGLSLTKKLVELHGGKIWVESEGKNRGSAFGFIIPVDK